MSGGKASLEEEVRGIVKQATSLAKSVGSVACVLRVGTFLARRGQVEEQEPTMEQRETARRLIFILSSRSAEEVLEKAICRA